MAERGDIDPQFAAAETAKLAAEAAKLRAEARELERSVLARPAFWGALVPLFAVVGSIIVGYATDFFEVQSEKVEAKRDLLNAEVVRPEVDQKALKADRSKLAAETGRLEEEKARIAQETRQLKEEIVGLRQDRDELKRFIEVAPAAAYIKNIVGDGDRVSPATDDTARLIAELRQNPQKDRILQMIGQAMAAEAGPIVNLNFHRILVLGTDEEAAIAAFEHFVGEATRETALMEKRPFWRAINPVEWGRRLEQLADLNIRLVMASRARADVVARYFEALASLDSAEAAHVRYMRLLHAHERRADLDAMAVSLVGDGGAAAASRFNALWALAVLNPKKYVVLASEIVPLASSGIWASNLWIGLQDAISVSRNASLERTSVEDLDLQQITDLPRWMHARSADFEDAVTGIAWDASVFG